MIGKSKFEYATFYSMGVFAVNAQKYTLEEAAAIYEQERDKKPMGSDMAAVVWRVGRNEDNEPCAGWWLDTQHNGTEPRYCPVWAFYF